MTASEDEDETRSIENMSKKIVEKRRKRGMRKSPVEASLDG